MYGGVKGADTDPTVLLTAAAVFGQHDESLCKGGVDSYTFRNPMPVLECSYYPQFDVSF